MQLKYFNVVAAAAFILSLPVKWKESTNILIFLV